MLQPVVQHALKANLWGLLKFNVRGLNVTPDSNYGAVRVICGVLFLVVRFRFPLMRWWCRELDVAGVVISRQTNDTGQANATIELFDQSIIVKETKHARRSLTRNLPE